MPQSAAALPDRFRDVEHLEDVMTTPSAALSAELRELPGDLMMLGVGGKIGPTLARLAKRAAPGKRVVGVARFSEPGLRQRSTPRASIASRPICSIARAGGGVAKTAQHGVHGRPQVRLVRPARI